jgi:hypothetical protein
MAVKELAFESEARAALLAGAEKLAAAVSWIKDGAGLR